MPFPRFLLLTFGSLALLQVPLRADVIFQLSGVQTLEGTAVTGTFTFDTFFGVISSVNISISADPAVGIVADTFNDPARIPAQGSASFTIEDNIPLQMLSLGIGWPPPLDSDFYTVDPTPLYTQDSTIGPIGGPAATHLTGYLDPISTPEPSTVTLVLLVALAAIGMSGFRRYRRMKQS